MHYLNLSITKFSARKQQRRCGMLLGLHMKELRILEVETINKMFGDFQTTLNGFQSLGSYGSIDDEVSLMFKKMMKKKGKYKKYSKKDKFKKYFKEESNKIICLKYNLFSIITIPHYFAAKRNNNLYKINLEDLNKQNKRFSKRIAKMSWKIHLLCESCQKEKQVKTSFKTKNIVSISRTLELLHMDLFGPTRMLSLDGNKYDFTYMTILLKSQTRSLGEKSGTVYNFSSLRIPQQNEVVERKNILFMEWLGPCFAKNLFQNAFG
ncbi:hypothetical protein CR513_57020, partial [Mucuna pruriens]